MSDSAPIEQFGAEDCETLPADLEEAGWRFAGIPTSTFYPTSNRNPHIVAAYRRINPDSGVPEISERSGRSYRESYDLNMESMREMSGLPQPK